jgi:7-cyano-7-deazaguanine reductase
VIDNLPGAWLIESKSLKLYLTSFRNQRAFDEDRAIQNWGILVYTGGK